MPRHTSFGGYFLPRSLTSVLPSGRLRRFGNPQGTSAPLKGLWARSKGLARGDDRVNIALIYETSGSIICMGNQNDRFLVKLKLVAVGTLMLKAESRWYLSAVDG